jgi:hypothetical protein
MKKLLLLQLVFFVYTTAIAQVDTTKFKTNSERAQYYMYRYQRQKQTALSLGIASAATCIVTYKFASVNNGKRTNVGYVIGGLFAGAGLFVLVDSDKWLKKAEIYITPTSFTFNF